MLKIGLILMAQKYLRKELFSWDAKNCFKNVEANIHWDFIKTFKTPRPPLVLSWYTTSLLMGFSLDCHRYSNISLLIELDCFLRSG